MESGSGRASTGTGVATASPNSPVEPSARYRAAPRLSLVVLPFANLSGDPDQEYFADGLTEDLTTDLSRIDGSFVIARNTAFTYKNKAVDMRQIGRDLGVRYVLEGSVRRSGDLVRVNAQLIDAETGAHLWADRFDRARADLIETQSEITAGIASTLRVRLDRHREPPRPAGAPEQPRCHGPGHARLGPDLREPDPGQQCRGAAPVRGGAQGGPAGGERHHGPGLHPYPGRAQPLDECA